MTEDSYLARQLPSVNGNSGSLRFGSSKNAVPIRFSCSTESTESERVIAVKSPLIRPPLIGR